jgi:hypothetical protein
MCEIQDTTTPTNAETMRSLRSDHCQLSSSGKDRPINPFRVAATKKAAAVVSEMKRILLNYEAHCALRKRKRKATDLQTFDRQVEALVCDLIHRELTCPQGALTISLANTALGSRDRYKPAAISKTIKGVLDLMKAPPIGWVEYTKGLWVSSDRSKCALTTIRAGEPLKQRIQEYGFTCADFKLDNSTEVIVLKDRKKCHDDPGAWLQYEDTDQTNSYRADLHRINEHLANAAIGYVIDGQQMVDLTDRHLQRFFNNGSFEQGGRLFGGFWMTMAKADRRNIQIDGTPTVTLDFGQMNPRILYGLADQDCAVTDAYSVSGLEQYRDGVKTVFNSLLHRTSPMTKMPRGIADSFPCGARIKDIVSSIRLQHHRIAKYFCTGIGMRLLYEESQILVEVLTELNRLGIVALPIHDAVIVAAAHQDLAMRVMLDVFQKRCGITGIVRVEA